VSGEERCTFFGIKETGASMCRLRRTSLSKAEINAKCSIPDIATICVDAYSSISKGQQAIDANSTDAFPWLIEAAGQFENIGETDNAIMAYVKAIDFAIKNDLTEKAYDFFRLARVAYENGLIKKDISLNNPIIKDTLLMAGNDIIEKMRKLNESAPMTDMQAELKAAVLGGVSLKKADKDEAKDLIISHGRALYEKKAEEYKDGAKSYIESGMIKNAVILACMGALADLMLGRPKEGMAYLTDIAASSKKNQEFQEHPCFGWTKMLFKILVNHDADLLISAKKLFLEIPWSFKDDREFARRIMDSIERQIAT
jgi:tetratricopeptide (TPR) repeat protein